MPVREIWIDRTRDGASGSREIGAWAERHYGLISRRKLLAMGLSEDRIDGLIRRGWLVLAAPGVYFVGHRSGVPGQREALALAAAGPGAVLAGPTAAAWRGMTEPWPGPVHLIVPHARYAMTPGVVRHVDVLDAADRDLHRGLALTTPARTAMDLPPDRLRQALQWLMRNAINVEPLVERMRGRRGAKAFRAEVAALVPQLAHTMSELEARFVRLCPQVRSAAPGRQRDPRRGRPARLHLAGEPPGRRARRPALARAS